MTNELISNIRSLPERLSSRILGQESALSVVSALARHWLAGLLEKAPRVLLLGPTGVGKTECALALAEALYKNLPVRFDMSEHQQEESLETLLGNRGGDIGLLRQKISPSSTLVLFDELEKAHPRVLDLFLQILDPGRVTAADGCQLDLQATPILCTSNLASAAITEVHELSPQSLEDHVLEQVRNELRPETLNRFDAIVIFQPLNLMVQQTMLRLQMGQYLGWLRTKGYSIASSPESECWLMLRGFDHRWGARPLRRAIRFHVGEAVVKALLRGESGSGVLGIVDQQLRILP